MSQKRNQRPGRAVQLRLFPEPTTKRKQPAAIVEKARRDGEHKELGAPTQAPVVKPI